MFCIRVRESGLEKLPKFYGVEIYKNNIDDVDIVKGAIDSISQIISDTDKSRQVELANTYVQAGASAQVLTQGAAPMYAEVRVLNMLGVELSSAVLNGPTIQVDMPRSAGIYVVEVILHQIDGTILRNVERVVVR